MAEVLSPLSSPTSTITMLQTRPASSDVFQSSAGSYQNPQRLNNTPRSIYNSAPAYRGPVTAPVQPYAFQSTPHLRQETRTTSSPAVPQSQASASSHKTGHRHSSSTSTISSDMSSVTSANAQRSPSKDDMFSGSARNSFINLSSSIPDLSLTAFDNTPKSSPNRYRRTPQRMDSSNSVNRVPSTVSAAPSGSGMASVEHLYTPPAPVPGTLQRTASDDLAINKTTSASEAAKRYRRRSLNSFEGNKLAVGNSAPQSLENQRPVSHSGQAPNTIRPVSFHSRTSSTESANNRRANATATLSSELEPPVNHSAQVSPVKVPVRNSSAANPSPLSRPAVIGHGSSPEEVPRPRTTTASTTSPAAQHLAALSDKDLNKGMKSRLRRAFSFGSAAELRRASENAVPPRLMGQGQAPEEELDPVQLEIARQQEAAGIGAGIYSGQGGFTGSTDNLSISSTASSASMMLRKMGKGMKKGGRSLKGLFRPKSVIGVPAADGPIQPSMAQVSMVTVEAERQKVNVNAHPAEHHGGGTGFPKLEKNSMDAVRGPAADSRSSNDRNDSMRKSIVGSDQERADVLAAVKKGILKRHGTSSPNGSPEIRPSGISETPITHSPASSMPATPRDERASRSMSSTTSDYFSGRLGAPAAKSMPNTPSAARNISFSPRIQFYDAWSSGDYDRRGDIATCNRLTPMLAQQIKEELNTFKMEMEVHELSKPHTHFF
ncbi:hypothetical protein AAFC00_006873 [Neodothiora populina]|uniref:Protein BNI4 n=1 Tax=Neodothiora populina TaxID=2781224 RepID=A0ABR3PBL1_9PEZI